MSKATELNEMRKRHGGALSTKSFSIRNTSLDYDNYIDNLLSDEENAFFASEYRNKLDLLDSDFEQKTGLNKVDITFLITATALQCIRQYLLSPMTKRMGDQEAANSTVGHGEEHSFRIHSYYRPSLEEVITNPVPFDANINSNGALTGAGKFGHRGATPGHDPFLGLVFGTANIATSTLTNYKMQSFHIKTSISAGRDFFANNASTQLVFKKTFEKIMSDDPEYGRAVVAAALAKEIIHLKSDVKSKNSLPLPIVGTLNPGLASSLAKYGIDTLGVLDFSKQATYTITINYLISILHGMYGYFGKEYNTEEEKKLFQVRTRKILLFSDIMASTSNILYTVFSGDVEKLDLGGLAVTLYRLFVDPRFFHKIKLEYINNNASKEYQKRFEEIAWYYS